MSVTAPKIAPVLPIWIPAEILFVLSLFYFLLQSLQVNMRDYAGTGLSTRIVITDFFVFRFKVNIYYLPTEWTVGSDPKDNLHG